MPEPENTKTEACNGAEDACDPRKHILAPRQFSNHPMRTGTQSSGSLQD